MDWKFLEDHDMRYSDDLDQSGWVFHRVCHGWLVLYSEQDSPVLWYELEEVRPKFDQLTGE
jgi:hypothetical protein